jgi:acylphosphatase
MKTIKIHITGKVQGVGYRYSALYKATELGINGYVKNNYDSTVTIVAEGEEEKLDEFVIWCHNGPPHAIVENVTVTETESSQHQTFKIK